MIAKGCLLTNSPKSYWLSMMAEKALNFPMLKVFLIQLVLPASSKRTWICPRLSETIKAKQNRGEGSAKGEVGIVTNK